MKLEKNYTVLPHVSQMIMKDMIETTSINPKECFNKKSLEIKQI